jgi:alanyl aminopeptidase
VSLRYAAAIAAALLAQPAAAQDATPPALRLPEGLRPVSYAAELRLRPSDPAFSGTIDIEVEAAKPVPVVWLHAKFITVDSARIGDRAVQVIATDGDFVGLRAEAPLAPGRATLHLEYRGELSARDSVGVFRMREGGDWYVYTQFESIFARRAFPCFDEPGYKVPWRLSLVVPQGDTAVANTPVESETALGDGTKRVRFAPTRPLPSYLIAFGVGPFDVVDLGRAGRKGTPLRIVTPKGQAASARYAAQVTPRILELSEDYTGIPYPYEKLDSLAVPRPGGAMENPGLITYASSLILARASDETPRFRQAYASVAAHEIAHLWFGDLVTHAWWDDVWLNESFATWMSDKTVDGLEPAWDARAKGIHGRNWAMKGDALVSARRIRQPIESANDIYNAFDGITYQKGGAVLGMFERWMGEARFAGALRGYLKAHADGVATARDFLAALSAVEPSAGGAFSSFLEQAGLPLLRIELKCGREGASARLSQRRYFPLGSAGGESRLWQLPVCLRYGGPGRERRSCTLLTAESASLPLTGACPAELRAEAARYYRVEYQPAGKLPRRLPAADLVAGIGDLSALVQGGSLGVDELLGRLSPLAGDPRRDVAQSLISAIGELRPLVEEKQRASWARWTSRLFGRQARALGFAPAPGESDDRLRLRPALIELVAGEGDDPALQAEARRLALRWLDDRGAVDGTMVDTVLQAAARRGGRAFFDRLRAALPGATDHRDRRSIYAALGAFEDPALAGEAFALLLDPAYEYREAQQVAWTHAGLPLGGRQLHAFVKANFDALVARAPRDAAASFPNWAGGCSEAERDDVEAFYRDRSPRYAGGPRVLAQALERITLCSAFKARQQAAFANFLGRQ